MGLPKFWELVVAMLSTNDASGAFLLGLHSLNAKSIASKIRPGQLIAFDPGKLNLL